MADEISTVHISDIVTDETLKAAANLAATAMLNSPAYSDVYIYGNEEWRLSQLNWLFYANFCLIAKKSPAALKFGINSTDGEMVCFFILGCFEPLTTWEKLEFLFALPFQCGIVTMHRLLATSEWYDNIESSLLNDRPCMKLQRMVVSPKYQGRGIGSRLLAKALIEADKQGLPVILGTQLEKNVGFYRKM